MDTGIGFLAENGETDALAAQNRLDIASHNEVMVIFTRFIEYVEGNSVGCPEPRPRPNFNMQSV
jgi:hypothetical protein